MLEDTGTDVIAKGWNIPTVEEKNIPDRIETCLTLANNTNITTETPENPKEKTETTTETLSASILKMLHDNPQITAKEIASIYGITEDGVAYHIKKLKKAGKIIRIGGSRNGGEWKVV